jgi:single-strand DNA-binding protein
MTTMNRVYLIGRLGRDPELRYTQGGSAVCTLSVATNDSWTDKAGQRQERTDWHRVVIFGESAEDVAKRLSKGSQAVVEGRLSTREYADKAGSKRSITEVIASTVISGS